jgi:hypothetical protein
LSGTTRSLLVCRPAASRTMLARSSPARVAETPAGGDLGQGEAEVERGAGFDGGEQVGEAGVLINEAGRAFSPRSPTRQTASSPNSRPDNRRPVCDQRSGGKP